MSPQSQDSHSPSGEPFPAATPSRRTAGANRPAGDRTPASRRPDVPSAQESAVSQADGFA